MLLLPKFDYVEPKDMAEACAIMADDDIDSKIIAGGTDIIVNMKKRTVHPRRLVSIAKLPGLCEMEHLNGKAIIGSHLIVAKLAEFELTKKRHPMLAKAARSLGSPVIRNRATIGGNIVTARPAADLPPPLLAMGAKVRLVSKKAERDVLLDDFFLGPGQTVMGSDEILTKIIIDDLPPFTGGDYLKLGHRKSLEIAIVAVASRITLDKPDGVITDARIILSSVAPKAIHATSAEKSLIGQKPGERLFEEAGRIAGTECTPITDIRGGAEYRCAMVEVLTKRTLAAALREAQAN